MKNKYLLGAIVLIIIIAGVAFFLLYQNKTGGQEAQISQDQKDVLQTNDKAKESVETIDLKTVGGYEGSGSAIRAEDYDAANQPSGSGNDKPRDDCIKAPAKNSLSAYPQPFLYVLLNSMVPEFTTLITDSKLTALNQM